MTAHVALTLDVQIRGNLANTIVPVDPPVTEVELEAIRANADTIVNVARILTGWPAFREPLRVYR